MSSLNHDQNRNGSVVVDGRMIESSGIGVVLRKTLEYWSENHPGFRLRILGDPNLLSRILPPQLDAEYIRFDQKVYGVSALTGSVPLRDIPVFFSPHYSVPVRVLGQPSVIMIQDLIHITHPTGPLTPVYMRMMLQFLRRRADYIVTPSRHTKVQLQTLYGFRPERVLTFPLGSGVCESDGSDDQQSDSEDEQYFLAVGIDKPHKGYDFLLQCYRQATSQNPDIPTLKIAGLTQRGRSRVARLIHQYRLEEKVRLLDYMEEEEFRQVFRNAKALVFCSRIEGFGLPLVEAMSAGVPVFCADLPPMNEITGNAAWHFGHDDPDSLVRLLCNDLDEEERLLKTQEGRSQAERYQWSFFADRLRNLFQEILKET